MPREVVRVKWEGGWHLVDDGGTGYTRTHVHDAGDLRTVDAAEKAGQTYLATLTGPRQSVTVGVTNIGATIPQLADTITVPGRAGDLVEQIEARRVEFGEDGFVAFDPTLGDQADVLQERMGLALRRLSGGLSGGRNAGATPTPGIDLGVATGPLRAPRVPPWSFSPPYDGSWGPLWPNENETMQLMKIVVSCWPAAPAAITVNFYVLDTLARTLIVPSGGYSASALLDAPIVIPNANIQAYVVSVGGASEEDLENRRLTVQVMAAPVDAATRTV